MLSSSDLDTSSSVQTEEKAEMKMCDIENKTKTSLAHENNLSAAACNLPLPMTRVNWPGISPSAMTLVPDSASPPPLPLRWEPGATLLPSGLNRGRCRAASSEPLKAFTGVMIIWWSSCSGARRLLPSNTSWWWYRNGKNQTDKLIKEKLRLTEHFLTHECEIGVRFTIKISRIRTEADSLKISHGHTRQSSYFDLHATLGSNN